MEVTIREAAPLLGRSTRAVRAWIARGELRATKRGRTWWIRLEDLPLTAEQRTSMQGRAQQAREALDAVLPSRVATTRSRRRRSVADLAPFDHGVKLLAEIERVECAARTQRSVVRAASYLRAALSDLGAAAYEFDAQHRTAPLRRARMRLGRAIAALLTGPSRADATVLEWCDVLEREVLPPLGGLLRWSERRGKGRR